MKAAGRRAGGRSVGRVIGANEERTRQKRAQGENEK
jgi:hypothetical protein